MFFPPFVSPERERQRRPTTNRFVIENDQYWSEIYHPRVRDLDLSVLNTMVTQRVNTFWNFPLHQFSSQYQAVYSTLLQTMVQDYVNSVLLRRLARFPNNNITLADIQNEFMYNIIKNLWDLSNQMLISNYPLNPDDLAVRTGRAGSDDQRTNGQSNTHDHGTTDNRRTTNSHDINLAQTDVTETAYVYDSKLATDDQLETRHDSEKIGNVQNTNTHNADTTSAVANSNTKDVQDIFVSPQDQGVSPNPNFTTTNTIDNQAQSSDGSNAIEIDSAGNFATQKTNALSGTTDGSRSDVNSTGFNARQEFEENEQLGKTARRGSNAETGETSQPAFTNTAHGETDTHTGAIFDTGSDLRNTETLDGEYRTGSHVVREETLDFGTKLQQYYDLNADRLMLELDNLMYPFYLVLHINENPDYFDGTFNFA